MALGDSFAVIGPTLSSLSPSSEMCSTDASACVDKSWWGVSSYKQFP